MIACVNSEGLVYLDLTPSLTQVSPFPYCHTGAWGIHIPRSAAMLPCISCCSRASSVHDPCCLEVLFDWPAPGICRTWGVQWSAIFWGASGFMRKTYMPTYLRLLDLFFLHLRVAFVLLICWANIFFLAVERWRWFWWASNILSHKEGRSWH